MNARDLERFHLVGWSAIAIALAGCNCQDNEGQGTAAGRRAYCASFAGADQCRAAGCDPYELEVRKVRAAGGAGGDCAVPGETLTRCLEDMGRAGAIGYCLCNEALGCAFAGGYDTIAFPEFAISESSPDSAVCPPGPLPLCEGTTQ